MSRIDRMLRSERGSIIVLAALVVPILLLVAAGGVTGFGLYASARELQKAADQSALAGAAALPPADPRVLVEDSPFPLPNTDPVYDQLPGWVPRIGYPVNDPRTVACTYGTASLQETSAGIVNAFADDTLLEPPLNDGGEELSTVCEDLRVYPRMESGSSFDPLECTNRLVRHVADATGTELLDPDLLDPVLSGVQDEIDELVKLPLNRVLPAALSPRMHVDVYSYISPPLLNLITGRAGGTMSGSATAYRRIKNAVVVPILPAQKLAIDLGVTDPVTVMTDEVNLNRALNTAQAPLIAAIDDADDRLDEYMATFGEPCQHLLHNLRQDLRDVYDPPTGPAPSALELVEAAVDAAERTSQRTGIPTPDPSNPDSLAGEAFVLVGIAVDEFMQPLAATQIPILDVALVVMNEVSDGSYDAAVVSAANAYGLFRASLVE